MTLIRIFELAIVLLCTIPSGVLGDDSSSSNNNRSSSSSVATLTASSPFSITFRPTTQVFSRSTLQVVKESITSTLLKQNRSDDSLLTAESVIQDQTFDEDTNSTRVKLFILATINHSEDASVSTKRDKLDGIIREVYTSAMGKITLLSLLHQSTEYDSLATLQSIKVFDEIPTPAASESGSSRRKLSKLDIALIVVCGIILVGILAAIYFYRKDRNFIESERTRFDHLQSLSAESDANSGYDTTPLPVDKPEISTEHEEMDAALYTPNTSASLEFDTKTQTPQSQVSRSNETVSLSSLPYSRHFVSRFAPEDEVSLHSMTATFDSSMFADILNKRSKALQVEQRDDHASGEFDSEDCSSSSGSSVDVFQVDIEAASSVATPDDKSTVVSAITEWMRSIQVVTSTDTKTSEMTQSTLDHSMSADRSEQSSSDFCGVESIEDGASLERSMAKSHLQPVMEVND